MVGRNFTGDGLVWLHWKYPAGLDVLTEIRRASTARDVRESLVALAYAVKTQWSLTSGNMRCNRMANQVEPPPLLAATARWLRRVIWCASRPARPQRLALLQARAWGSRTAVRDVAQQSASCHRPRRGSRPETA